MAQSHGFADPLLNLIRHYVAKGETSMSALARHSGIARGTLYVILGDRENDPSIYVLKALARAINVNIRMELDQQGKVILPPPRLPRPPIEKMVYRKRPLTDALIAQEWHNSKGDLHACCAALRAKPSSLWIRLVIIGLVNAVDANEGRAAARLETIMAWLQRGDPVRKISKRLGISNQRVYQLLSSFYISDNPTGPQRLLRTADDHSSAT